MIGGFEEPDEGAIHLGDKDVVGLPPHKRDVNTVFQSYALFPHLSIYENVAFGLRRKGVDKRSCRAGSRRCCVSSVSRASAGGKPRQLSGRPAAARRARARARQPAAGAAARRAARRTRPEAAQAAPARAEGDPARPRDHLRPRHARPGGGDDDGRHDRGHERRPGRAARASRRSSTSGRATEFVAGFLGVSNLLRGTVTAPARPDRGGRGSSVRRSPAAPASRGRRPAGEVPPRPAGGGREHAVRHGQGDRLRRRRHACTSSAPRPARPSSTPRTSTAAGRCPSQGRTSRYSWSPESTFVLDHPTGEGERHEPVHDPQAACSSAPRSAVQLLTLPGLPRRLRRRRGRATAAAADGRRELDDVLRFSNWQLYIDSPDDEDEAAARRRSSSSRRRRASRSTTSRTSTTTPQYFGTIQRPLRRATSSTATSSSSPTTRASARYITNGWALKLDKSAIPNMSNLIDAHANPTLRPRPRVLAAVALGDDRDRLTNTKLTTGAGHDDRRSCSRIPT